MDMLNGGLVGKLILFSLPLAFSSILQQLFNSADVAVVGRFAGDNALAAVGSCVALVGIFVNLIVGLAVGPNAVLANLIGQKQPDKINDMVHTILTFGTILGLGLMILGFASARIILELSGTPSGVLAEALLYIRIYFLSIPFMTVYNFGAAILRSFGDTRRPMFYLIISGIINVILNLILVICFHLGVAGVAISTVISNVISAVMVMVYLYRRDDEFAFRFNRMKIVRPYLRKILQIGIPSGIQGTIFSISNVFIQSGINSFGKFAIAGSSLALNFEYFTYDIANAFAQATVTFTSQNYGAGNIKRCKKVFWLNMLFGIVFTEILAVIFIVWLTNYTNNYNTENTRLKKSIKIKTIFTIALYVIYYIVIVICIIQLGWNLMESITYVLSIPPIIIPFIIKMIKPDLSLKVWIHSYENKENYASAKKMLETYQEKVTQQEALVNKLTLELTK